MMKALLWAALAFAATPALAVEPTDMDGAKTTNGKIIHDFIELEINQHKPAEAFDRYVAKTYKDRYMGGPTVIQNNDFEGQKVAETKVFAESKSQVEFKKMIVQHDLVFVQLLATNPDRPVGNQLWILYLLKGGKIVEHWDLHGQLPPNSDPKDYF